MLLIVYGGKPHTSHVLLQTIPYKMWNLTSRETTWIAMNLINPLHCETHWTASVLRFRFHLIAQDVILPKRATGMRAHQACAKPFTVLFLIASERQGVCVRSPFRTTCSTCASVPKQNVTKRKRSSTASAE